MESVVTISGLPCVELTKSHNEIECTVPQNYGVGHSLIIVAAGQVSESFRYISLTTLAPRFFSNCAGGIRLLVTVPSLDL